jgi:hypothetical protein
MPEQFEEHHDDVLVRVIIVVPENDVIPRLALRPFLRLRLRDFGSLGDFRFGDGGGLIGHDETP